MSSLFHRIVISSDRPKVQCVAVQSQVRFSVVFVTAPDLKAGRRLADAALKSRLVACANLIPGIESHYWWKGKIESSAEVLIVFKTTKLKLKALEKLIVASHPYDTPEFIVLPITAGTKRYLDWVSKNVIAR
jgi:periplasmic divalent cation tolerance protein